MISVLTGEHLRHYPKLDSFLLFLFVSCAYSSQITNQGITLLVDAAVCLVTF